MRYQNLFLTFAVLVCWLFSAVSLGNADCLAEDDEAYTLYVYGDTDARVLLDQKCQTATGESQMDKVLSKAECKCYDKKVSDVLSRLLSSGGPVAVTTRKVTGVYAGITCSAALEKCTSACQETAKALPKACAAVQTAGVSSN